MNTIGRTIVPKRADIDEENIMYLIIYRSKREGEKVVEYVTKGKERAKRRKRTMKSFILESKDEG